MSEINTWPGWECVRLLGEGSFGKVYEIERRDAFGSVKSALKIITIPNSRLRAPATLSSESKRDYYRQTVEKIYQEIILMDQLKGHSNIVSYMDHSITTPDDGASWIILIRMSLLTPFSQYLESHEMTIPEVIRLGVDIGKALSLCHSKMIMHRDIKPENIFLNPDTGDFALGDFGISRTLEKEAQSNLTVAGTYNYMAPEVFRKKPYGFSADIYSLALVLYELLNQGNPPFVSSVRYSEDERQQALNLRFAGNSVPAPKNGSIQLVSCILKALSYDPSNRFESANDFIRALQACPEYIKTEEPFFSGETVYAETPVPEYTGNNHQHASGANAGGNDFFANNNYAASNNNYSIDPTNNKNNNINNNNNSNNYRYNNAYNNYKSSNNEKYALQAVESAEAKEARERAEREKAAQEKAAREKAAQEKAAREKAAREKAAQEKAAREKAAQEKAAREKAAQEKAAREKAAQEKAAREKAAQEKAAREKAAQEKAERENLAQRLKAISDEKTAQEKAGRKKTAQIENNKKAVSKPAPNAKGNFITRHPVLIFLIILYAIMFFRNEYIPNAQLRKEALADMTANHVQDHVMEWHDDELEAKMRQITRIKLRKIKLSDIWTYTELNLHTYGGTNITNISALSEMTNLEKLDLSSNEIQDIRALSSLKGLKHLSISDNKINDLHYLHYLSELSYLDLAGNEINDLSPISDLVNLDYLDLARNQLSDISYLDGLTKLIQLDLSYNQISDISPLAGLKNLKDLDLGSNHLISDISYLAELTNLDSLQLEDNQITDISALSGLTNLTRLYLYDNQISQIDSLSGMTELNTLNLSYNFISDISPLSSLQKLESLNIKENNISDRTPLNDLPADCKIEG